MNNNVWKDVEEFKIYFNNFITLRKKTLKNYNVKFWDIEMKKWHSLSAYNRVIFSNKFTSIDEFLKKQKIKNKIKKTKNKKIIKNKLKYKEYIKSKEWNLKRMFFIRKCKNQCQCCLWYFEDKNLQLHHHSYTRLWDEFDSDLVLVCLLCHNNIHFQNWKKTKLDEKSLRKRFDEIKKINFL